MTIKIQKRATSHQFTLFLINQNKCTHLFDRRSSGCFIIIQSMFNQWLKISKRTGSTYVCVCFFIHFFLLFLVLFHFFWFSHFLFTLSLASKNSEVTEPLNGIEVQWNVLKNFRLFFVVIALEMKRQGHIVFSDTVIWNEAIWWFCNIWSLFR